MDITRTITILAAVLFIIFWVAAAAVFIYLISLIIRALKENRLRCKMTQEFVAETLGVSRQAVSKWENGTADPSTSNLLALSKLYGISAEELLKSVDSELKQEKSSSGREEK